MADAADSVDGVNRGTCTAVFRALNVDTVVTEGLGAADGVEEGAGGGTAGAGSGDRILSAGTFQPFS